MASWTGHDTTATLLVYVFSLLRCGESADTSLALYYGPIVGHYNSLGQFWCQAANLPCETDGECCSGCCQSALGLCSSRNEDCGFRDNPCNVFLCPMTTICAVLPNGQPHCVPVYNDPLPLYCTTDCPAGYICQFFMHVNPPYSKCVVNDPCGRTVCPPGEICQSQVGVGDWQAKCVPNPCNSIICPTPGYTCRVKPNSYPLTAECVPIGPCATIRCASWYVCEDVPFAYPPQGRCVPSLSDPCLNIRCDRGTQCVRQYNVYPPTAMCTTNLPEITCASVTCREGYTCVMNIIQQPRPQPECVIARPCSYRVPCMPTEICLERQPLCFDKVPCPRVAECFSRNPCASVRCGRGYTCQLVRTYCYAQPCPPMAECVLTNPCNTEVSPCKPYEDCVEVDVQCLVAPCAPIAQCRPRLW